MTSVAMGVWELEDGDERTWYRLMYLTRISDTIHVLHCFEKDSRENRQARSGSGEGQAEGNPAKTSGCEIEHIDQPGVVITNHVTTGEVLDELGFSRWEASALKIKTAIEEAMLAEIDRRGFTQRQLVDLLDEYQPNVSNLLHGRIRKVSIEKLLSYTDRLKMRSSVEL